MSQSMFGKEIMQDLLIKKIGPDCPPLAMPAASGGTVILNVEISKPEDVVNTSLFQRVSDASGCSR
jgi:hypothetical protein